MTHIFIGVAFVVIGGALLLNALDVIDIMDDYSFWDLIASLIILAIILAALNTLVSRRFRKPITPVTVIAIAAAVQYALLSNVDVWRYVVPAIVIVIGLAILLGSLMHSMKRRKADQKAAALFSPNRGRTWGEFTIVADDPTGKILWWDQMCALLPDGRIYTLIWTHLYGTSRDLTNHWIISEDQGQTWTHPRPTNLRGQVCTPIPLPDGRIAAIYNFRHDPQGIHLALTHDMESFDVPNEVVVFDAGAEATLGDPGAENFLAEHMQIAFGKPGGVLLQDDTIMTYFWCTVDGVTHTRWARVRVE